MEITVQIPDRVLAESISKKLESIMPDIKNEALKMASRKMLLEDAELDPQGAMHVLGTMDPKTGHVTPISRRTLTNLIKRKRHPLPHYYIGNRLRFRRVLISAWKEEENIYSMKARLPKVERIDSGGKAA